MSSIRITTTFGLPGTGRTGAFQWGRDSLSVLPIRPAKVLLGVLARLSAAMVLKPLSSPA